MRMHKRIGELKLDLEVVVVVQKEEGHEEPTNKGRTSGVDDCRRYETEWVIDKPELTKPDTTKREAARQELQRIYDHSKWYQVFLRARIDGILGR